MKRITKILAAALIVVLMIALVACNNDDTQKRVDAVKKNYRDAGYTVTQIQKDDDLVKDKTSYLTDVHEVYKITKSTIVEGQEEPQDELYLLFVFKDDTKAKALNNSYNEDDTLRASGTNVVIVAIEGENTKPFMDAYEDLK